MLQQPFAAQTTVTAVLLTFFDSHPNPGTCLFYLKNGFRSCRRITAQQDRYSFVYRYTFHYSVTTPFCSIAFAYNALSPAAMIAQAFAASS